jgi:hypothetical protein
VKPDYRAFDAMCEKHGIPVPKHEYAFAKSIGRNFRFDHCWNEWLALEVQGGIWTGGRHVRGAALLDEHEKLRYAVLLGYSVIFCTPKEVESGEIFAFVREVLEAWA